MTDDQLLKFFAKDFTKTMSVLLKVVPASKTLDLRVCVMLVVECAMLPVKCGVTETMAY